MPQQSLQFTHACATRPAEWPENAHLVLAMRRPRWRTRPVLEAGGRSVPAAGPSDEMRTPEGLQVLDELIAIAQEDPSRPLVVMCWERLDGPKAHTHCHRTVLVELLEERAREWGLEVGSSLRG